MKAISDVLGGSVDSRLPQLKEVRFLTFEKDALLEALKLHLIAAKKPLPPGILKSCEILQKPEISVTIKIIEDATGAEKVTTFSGAALGAAMIAYCLRLKVPLPRTAEKSLVVSGESLQLRVEIRGREPKAD